MGFYSPNTFTIELSDGKLRRVRPLSMLDRLEFAEVAEEMMDYVREIVELEAETSFQDLLIKDDTFRNYVELCLKIAGLEYKLLSPDSILGLLFPYEEADGTSHLRGLLFERNFPENGSVGSPLKQADVDELLYQRLAELSLHFDSLQAALDVARDMPAEMLERIADIRSGLMKDSTKSDKERMMDKGKKQAKADLEKMFNGS